MSKIATLPKSGGIFIPQNQTQPSTQTKRAVKLIGPACVGKTMVSNLLIDHGALHYSSSAALTAFAQRHGRQDILEKIKKGDLVDIEDVKLVSGWDFQDFLHYRSFAVFDGWGRVPTELEVSLPILKKKAQIEILLLDARPEILLERARARKRGDDDAINNRLQIHFEHAQALRSSAIRLLGKDRVHVLDTTHLTPDQVKDAVKTKLGLAA
jgi:hypothetical protein